VYYETLSILALRLSQAEHDGESMKRSSWFTTCFEVINAILIAVVSLTTAFAVWRTNVVGSNADNENRQGLIDAVKKKRAFGIAVIGISLFITVTTLLS
jgi:uncharacterized membrane protein